MSEPWNSVTLVTDNFVSIDRASIAGCNRVMVIDIVLLVGILNFPKGIGTKQMVITMVKVWRWNNPILQIYLRQLHRDKTCCFRAETQFIQIYIRDWSQWTLHKHEYKSRWYTAQLKVQNWFIVYDKEHHLHFDFGYCYSNKHTGNRNIFLYIYFISF